MRCESLFLIVGRHGCSENNTLRNTRPEEGKGRKESHPADVLMQYENHPQPKPTTATHWFNWWLDCGCCYCSYKEQNNNTMKRTHFMTIQRCAPLWLTDDRCVYMQVLGTFTLVPVPQSHWWTVTGGFVSFKTNVSVVFILLALTWTVGSYCDLQQTTHQQVTFSRLSIGA